MTTPKALRPEVDPDAPPSERELRAAAALREALADPAGSHEDAELARALAVAHDPREISLADHRLLVEEALVGPVAAARKGRVIRVAFGLTATVFAVAAAAALLVRPAIDESKAPPPVALAHARSTQPLFHEPFTRLGGESARIDRMAMARAGDLRDNEFARWGVR